MTPNIEWLIGEHVVGPDPRQSEREPEEDEPLQIPWDMLDAVLKKMLDAEARKASTAPAVRKKARKHPKPAR